MCCVLADCGTQFINFLFFLFILLKKQVFINCQYLQPSEQHLPVERFLAPEEFDHWREAALETGFAEIVSGPFVRSSYPARELSGFRILPIATITDQTIS